MNRKRLHKSAETDLAPASSTKPSAPASFAICSSSSKTSIRSTSRSRSMRWGIGSAVTVAVLGCLLYALNAECRGLLTVKREPMHILAWHSDAAHRSKAAEAMAEGLERLDKRTGPWVSLRDVSGMVRQWAPLLGHSSRGLLQEGKPTQMIWPGSCTLHDTPCLRHTRLAVLSTPAAGTCACRVRPPTIPRSLISLHSFSQLQVLVQVPCMLLNKPATPTFWAQQAVSSSSPTLLTVSSTPP